MVGQREMQGCLYLERAVQGAGVPEYVQHLHFIIIGNEDGEPRAVHRQVDRVICQLPLQHTFLPAVVPDPAYKHAAIRNQLLPETA